MLDASDVLVVLDQLERPGWWCGWMAAGALMPCWATAAGRTRTWTWSSPATTERQQNTRYPAWGSNLT
jgi:hypothetical protein